MKETKVYTGRRNGKHAELMQRLDKALKEQHFAFVFTKQELKERDRELVKEVCEKIREYLRTQVIYCGGRATELDIMIASAGNQVLEDVKQFLDQIQKLEGEDE